jgi:AmmeMemoRadiSam system protein A
MTTRWSADQRGTLLVLARQALVAAVRRQPPPAAAGSGVFDQHAGVFVTLRTAGDLRGCIGQVEPQRLADLVVHCAGAAALEDPRFPPVADIELPRIHIELSVLGPLTQLADPAGLEPGRHGLVVSSLGRRGLLLPQVATEWEWTRDEFLRQTCLKAGLSADAWRQGAQLFTFEAEIFGEPDS